MNSDVLAGKWKQLKGEIKRQWGYLTDDDLNIAEGHYDKLVGMVQERYGYAREEAKKEVDQFLTNYEASVTDRP
jgi:uncharacterized protein YjbJ (UPF0337 family)